MKNKTKKKNMKNKTKNNMKNKKNNKQILIHTRKWSMGYKLLNRSKQIELCLVVHSLLARMLGSIRIISSKYNKNQNTTNQNPSHTYKVKKDSHNSIKLKNSNGIVTVSFKNYSSLIYQEDI